KEGSSVAVAGFGGLGMMAVKYAVKMGAKVSVFARNENKKADALAMGVSSFYTSCDKNAVKERFDLIISTIPTPYNPAIYLDLLKFGGEMAIVGLPPHEVAPSISVITFVHKAGKKVYGSLIGGIAETQEMLDFSLKHGIYPETELITPQEIDKAYENLTSGKAKFRYVIDMTKE
ncbi:zinc-binding dehydrogenase, partial [Campylobacter jejuni]